MKRLSVTIITKNEERNLPRCLESVSFADEIVVIDSQSTDRTKETAEELGALVYDHVWRGYGPAKREAVARASGDWILSLDADEALSEELAGEIKRVVESDHSCDGYFVRRRTKFLGRWMRHCGWYPDYVLRLFKKEKGNFNEAQIHESVEVSGKTGKLEADILHYCYETLEQYLEKSNRYTTLGAEAAYKNGKRTRLFDLTTRPWFSFINHYILKAGFLDGIEGLQVSLLSAQAVFHKYTKLRQLQRQSGG